MAGIAASAAALPAHAQLVTGGAEITNDETRRGLSWSEGRVSTSADVTVDVIGIDASARVAMLRESDRHGRADAVLDLEAGTSLGAGPVRFRVHGTGHVFVNAVERMDYLELGGSGSFTLGPVEVDAGLVYAPDQSSIGGDNLYLNMGARAGIPSTPLSVSARVGRTSGSTDDPRLAARLRPAGNYADWRLGVEYVAAPLTLGLDYVGTDIDRSQAIASPYADISHTGDRLIAKARISF
ncbi:TorF family putative porin [Sphingomonas sp. HF-S3]|uniref:TorF family putative porin n=1 Tax=Sphingomonas rustica TaxID=3103142 RepID=A0ABV0BED3_9SPHN